MLSVSGWEATDSGVSPGWGETDFGMSGWILECLVERGPFLEHLVGRCQYCPVGRRLILECLVERGLFLEHLVGGRQQILRLGRD